MPPIDVPIRYNGLSHTPPYIKENEALTLYNPFYYDLSSTRVTIDPRWASAPGITLNWLAQSINGHVRLILGVEADTPGNFLAFADRFAVGHNLTERDAAYLHMLGHPTLAHIGSGPSRGADLGSIREVREYANDSANYAGIIGGELRYEQGRWWITDNSGRYGAHLAPTSDPSAQSFFRDTTLERVKEKFMEYANIDVAIR